MTRSFPVVAVIGSSGLPAKYGGFETLVENLARYHQSQHIPVTFTVYCSGKVHGERKDRFCNAKLEYVDLDSNGPQSIIYDIISMARAAEARSDVIILLGVSGAIGIPFLRLFSRAKVIANIDGIEWKRAKWNWCARTILRISEWVAVRCAHVVIADNEGIRRHVLDTYRADCIVIPYGGDQFRDLVPDTAALPDLPERYALAICRVEPENHADMIIDVFARQSALALVFVGNWNASAYGKAVRAEYAVYPHVHLLDPIYEPTVLAALRMRAVLYVHGHSAGGTNPSLVEAMHHHPAIVAFDCCFNRFTTEDKAIYFADADELAKVVAASACITPSGDDMREIANRRYTWSAVAAQYFDLIKKELTSGFSTG